MLSLMPLFDSSNDILSIPESSEKLGRCDIFTLFQVVSLLKLFFNIFLGNLLLFLIFLFFSLASLSSLFFLTYQLKLVICFSLFFLFVFFLGLLIAARCDQETCRPYYEHANSVFQFFCILALWQKSCNYQHPYLLDKELPTPF